ncbi:hypothetical protein FGG78_25065 [Thioclava sp. BHET1]|nr:hypothetical protein FGG78_25065 [Thioclava sp. BHET1]
MEQLNYSLLLRGSVVVGFDNRAQVLTMFKKNRDRLMSPELFRKMMAAILARREVAPLLPEEHFSVDGTMVKA